MMSLGLGKPFKLTHFLTVILQCVAGSVNLFACLCVCLEFGEVFSACGVSLSGAVARLALPGRRLANSSVFSGPCDDWHRKRLTAGTEDKPMFCSTQTHGNTGKETDTGVYTGQEQSLILRLVLCVYIQLEIISAKWSSLSLQR